jgi:hypothetical protein
MRLWSLHPTYLDSKGLVALWREGLLAKAVLEGKTKGYKNHPQLIRFKNNKDPLLFLDTYLDYVYLEAKNRNYNFNHEKIGSQRTKKHLNVTQGQLEYELKHLKRKLKSRDITKFKELEEMNLPLPHPIFKLVPGEIELWENIKKD